jgi:tRNA (guanine-N7-)-methyltransferase
MQELEITAILTMTSHDDSAAGECGEEYKNGKGKRPATTGPITEEGNRPQKKFYRQRAHCNPLSHNDAFDYPTRPDMIDWTAEHFPNSKKGSFPTVLDIGCGFGGLTMALGEVLPPEAYILGMEIRAKVTEYVRLRIIAARMDNPGKFLNCSVLRTNAMKFAPNYFRQSSIEKMFICFPDPHFKRKNHPRRIITERLLSEYAFILKPKIGRLYTITDVEELHEWHVAKCDLHPLFRRIDCEEAEKDPCVLAMKTETEEGKKVSREGREKYYAVYERIENAAAPKVTSTNCFI